MGLRKQLLKAVGRVWTSRDGKQIPVREMTDSHLLNVLRMLTRNAERSRERAISEVLAYPAPTAEMASDCYEQGCEELFDSDWTDFVPPIFEHLEAEAERRGLKAT